MKPILISSEVLMLSAHKEQVVFHLSAEFDGLYLLAMPAAEGHVFFVEVPVATLNLPQQLALRSFGGAEDGVGSDIVCKHREQQRILSIVAEQVEVAHQVNPQQQVTLLFGERSCRIFLPFLHLMTITNVWPCFRPMPALKMLDTGDCHFKLLFRVGQIVRRCPYRCHAKEAEQH